MTPKEENIIKKKKGQQRKQVLAFCSKIETENNIVGKYLADLIQAIGKLRTSQVRIAFFIEQLKKRW
ncbi:hypothetical protein ES703_14263 [subsurface metagenome]